MKVLLFVFFAALLATAKSLNCYECTNCENIGDRAPSTCAAKPTEAPPTEKTETTETTEITTTRKPEEPPTAKKLENVYFSKLSGSNEILRNLRSVSTRQRRAADDWFCYAAYYTVNGKRQVNRGCTSNVENNKCPADLESSLPGQVSQCTLCQNDGCNGSAIAKLSFFALCFVLITKLFV